MQFVAEASKETYESSEPGQPDRVTQFSEPRHLAPIVATFERTESESVRAAFSVPCQHGKTTLVQYAIVWLILRKPWLRVAYCTYSQEFAATNAKTIRQIAERCGVEFDLDTNTIKEWKTVQGGGVYATSVDGGLTGRPVSLCVLDDYYKNREEAESRDHRAKVSNWFRAVVNTRVPPNGSIIVNASRWHQEDLTGEIIDRKKGRKYEYINLPAINENGEALCPWGPDPDEPRNLKFLLEQREELGDYDFESLFQGNPIPASGSVFNDPTFGERPTGSGKISVGVDLAYSAGAGADYSVAVALFHGDDGRKHVLDVARWKCSPSEIAGNLRGFLSNYPGARVASYVSGPEKAVFDLIAREGVKVSQMPAVGIGGSKFLRTQATAAAWNAGKLTLPQRGAWVDVFAREIKLFTGSGSDTSDDQVDALASAFDCLRIKQESRADRKRSRRRR